MYTFFVLGLLFLAMLSFIRIDTKVYCAMIIIYSAIFLYNFDPYLPLQANPIYSVDSIRYFATIDNFRVLGDSYDKYAGSPLSRLYLYGFSQLFSDNNLIYPITIFIYYGVSFYILYKFAKKNSFSIYATNVTMILFFVTSDVMKTIEGIRYPIAVSLFMLVFYYDVIVSKRYIAILYIIPFLMHTGTIMLIVLRVMSSLEMKKSCGLILLLVPFLGIYGNQIITYIVQLISILPIDGDVLYTLMELQLKINNYGGTIAKDSDFGLLGYVMIYVKILFIFCMVVYVCHKYKTHLFRNDIMLNFSILGTFIVLLLVIFNISYRLTIPLRLFAFFPYFISFMIMFLVNKKSQIMPVVYTFMFVLFVYTFFQSYKNTLAVGL